MSTVHPPLPRAMVFVDGSNFYHRMKDAFGRADISYLKFMRWLGLKWEIVQLLYYVGEIAGDPQHNPLKLGQEKFLEFLRRTQLVTVRLGYIQRTNDEWEEKGVDTLVASDLVTKAHLNEYDVAILVTADGDLAAQVAEVRKLGKTVYVAQFSKFPSYHLRQVADGLIELDCQEVRDCLRPPKKPT